MIRFDVAGREQDKCNAFFTMCVFSVVDLVCGLVATLVALSDEDDACIEGSRGGLTIAQWLLGVGILNLVGFSVCVALASMICCDKVREADATYRHWLKIGLGFGITWSIWGIIVMSTHENSSCVADGARVGLVPLVLLLLSYCVCPCLISFIPQYRLTDEDDIQVVYH